MRFYPRADIGDFLEKFPHFFLAMVNGGTSVGAGEIPRVCDVLPTATIPVWRWENQRLSVRYVAADGTVVHDVFHMPKASDREFLDAVRSVHNLVAGTLGWRGCSSAQLAKPTSLEWHGDASDVISLNFCQSSIANAVRKNNTHKNVF